MQFTKARTISLKSEPGFNEKWLQGLLAEDPGLLGLGDLVVKDIERRQPRAGRLDMLLSDPETHTRYEVEIQLGPTDESHIIRTIEYWDVEKNRYPQYEHVAVIVAEDITSRFLNVISLLNRTIPLIAIQVRALEVNGVITLTATKVLDLFNLGTDEEDEPGAATDRAYWVSRASQASVALVDSMLELVHEVVPGRSLSYNKYYIGTSRDGISDLFVKFRPRKKFLIAEFRIPRSDETTALIEDSGLEQLEYDTRWGNYRVRLSANDIVERRDLLLELIRRASGSPAVADE